MRSSALTATFSQKISTNDRKYVAGVTDIQTETKTKASSQCDRPSPGQPAKLCRVKTNKNSRLFESAAIFVQFFL